jgi:acetylglutamate kinase
MNYMNIIKLLTQFSPSLEKLKTSPIVIKYGGAAMNDPSLTNHIIQDIVILHNLGLKIIIVHGGGPFINLWLDKTNIQTVFKDGMRVTDHQTMEIVEMVLSGKINKELVASLNSCNIPAIGLSGKDASLITASSIDGTNTNCVGQIDLINPLLLNTLINNNYLPVIAPIGSDFKGKSYNINADIVAGEIASVMNAQKLIIITDKPGILLEISDPTTLLQQLNIANIKLLIKQNIIKSGMLPKVECCLQAISKGVGSTHIIDGRISHSLLLSLSTNNSVGSTILP